MEERSFELEDLAAELVGIENTISVLSLIVTPKDACFPESAPTETTLTGMFFSLSRSVARIADELSEIAAKQIKQTPRSR